MKDKEEPKSLAKPEENNMGSEVVILNELSRRILGGPVGGPSIDYEQAIKDWEATGEPMSKEITVIDPVSKKQGTYLIERGGTSDQKLAMVLLDPNTPKEQKDAVLSLFLFEKGKESSSFLMDLMMYKGQHMKESRQFLSRIQMDWTFFANLMCNIMLDQANSMIQSIAPGKDIIELQRLALSYLKEQEKKWDEGKKEWQKEHESDSVRQEFPKRRPVLRDWATEYFYSNAPQGKQKDSDNLSILMLELGVRYAAEAHNIQVQLHNMTEQREAERGKPFPSFKK